MTETKKINSTIIKCALFLGIISFCIYINTFTNGYAVDDNVAISRNELVTKGVSAIPQILSTPYHYGSDIAKGTNHNAEYLYRPLSLVLFATEYQLFGENPAPGHIINVLLYSCCVILLFLFLHRLFKKKRIFIAFTGALLFALHPIHTEIVANIKSGDELLCFLFGFLSLNAFIKYLDSKNIVPLVCGLVFYFLSLLSKETSITFMAVIPFVFFFYRNENKKRSVYISVLSLIPVIVYLLIRYSVLTPYNDNSPSNLSFIDNALIGAPSFASRLATEILILGYYVKLMIVPYPLISDYGYNSIPFATFSDIGVWLSLIVYGLLIYFSFSRLVKKRSDPPAFGIVFFLITVSLFSNILFSLQSMMAERFIFTPSVGFCVMLAFILEQAVFRSEVTELKGIKNKTVLLILIPVSIIFTWITVSRNSEWKDNFTLFRADSKKSPNNFRLYYFAGNEELLLSGAEATDPATKNELLTEGIEDLQKSVAIYPDFYETQSHLAYAFTQTGKMDSAEVHCKKALMLNPNDVNTLTTMAGIYVANKKYQDAMVILKKTCAINPGNPAYLYNLAICNVYTHEYDHAIYYFKKVVALAPSNRDAIKFIATLFNAEGLTDSASKYEAIMKRYDPRFNVNNISLPR